MSNRVLLSLRDLLRCFPDQIDISECLKKEGERELLLRVIDWLEDQGVLDVSGQGIRLTEEGHKALGRAAVSNPVLAEFLDFRRDILSQVEATQAMLAIVRSRFTQNGAND
ncbi:MAG: hypothetical protein ACR2OM_03190 [Aestuariivirgaceae bacterium]